ncbi:MAG: FtsX-like permease family protein [Ignavibacteriales bacterium]|nr:FtsX-like permease family protein [Ignavibacteriales bacterium]
MKIRKLVFKETFQRGNQLVTSLTAITLGIAVIVGIKNISVYSEKAVSRELDALGANVLILPKSATVQDYYSADFQEEEIPESYVDVLINSDIQGLDNLSPKLSVPVEVNGQKTVLTGIMPKNEFKSKATWQGALGVFSRPEGCGTVPNIPGLTDSKKTQVRKRVIEDLSGNAVLVGCDIAQKLKLQEGDSLRILKQTFFVNAVLPVTGTVDDNRIFAHLHTVQNLNNRKSALNVIEIVGCCSEISKGLIQKLNKLLPDAKVVTITQIVSTQINTNNMMNNLSLLLLIIIVIIGGATIANYMFANVYERRREIGILMAMGATPGWIVKLFLLKSLLIGLAGGIIGYIVGTLIAVVLGPRLADIPVLPIPMLAVYGILVSILVSLIASILPIIRATKVDPHVIMQED